LTLTQLGPLPTPLQARAIKRPKVCLVIPVFNEEAVLLRTFTEVSKALGELEVEWNALLVNDGSNDATLNTVEQLFQHEERVGYLVLSRNFGHQGALAAGLDHADGDVVISMDADLQHPPELLRVLIDAWRAGYDVVHTQKVRTEGRSRRDALAATLTYKTVVGLAGVRIIPHASDFRLLDRAALAAVRSLPERAKLYRGLTTWIGYRQCVVRYVAAERAAGRSHYRLGQRLVVVASELFDFTNTPLYVGLFAGGAALLFSLLYLAFIVIWFFTGDERPPGWASLISVTLVLNSIGLLFLGIIGVYVARIYDEVRGRPPYLIAAVREHRSRETSTD
jgi:glycosyltransferase involved in cell wall biosynthesis